MRICYTLFYLIFLLGCDRDILVAQMHIDVNQSVKMYAEVSAQPPLISPSWVRDSSATGYILYRRNYADNGQWQVLDTLGETETAYTDTEVVTGRYYEYKIVKSTESDTLGYGYVLSGIAIPAVHQSGRLLIVLTDSTQQFIQPSLDVFRQHLLGDGWPNTQVAVANDANAAEVKQAIIDAYNQQAFSAVLILGDVPIPHSGDVNPDNHNDHRGAWSADIYYGDLDGIWTDTLVNNTTSDNYRNHNVPNDGKWDQSYLPSDVEVAVGRVDFSNMTVFDVDEYEMLRRYLTKDIAYRRGVTPVRRRAMISNYSSWAGGLGQNGIRNFSPLVSPDSLDYDEWLLVFSRPYQWYYGGSSGNYTVGYLLGDSQYYANRGFKAIFTGWFGSYHGDYDYPDAYLRAILGSGTVLSTAWIGAPHWHFHEMGMGFPLATATRTSQNNDTLYSPGLFARGIHINLLGDPTSKAYTFAGPQALTATNEGTAFSLNWTAAPSAIDRYYIYRKTEIQDAFSLLDSVGPSQTTYLDACPTAGFSYQYLVRASRLETTASGSFYNLSAGVASEVAMLNDYTASASFEAIQDGNFLTLTSTSENADSLRWLLPDGTTLSTTSITFEISEGNSTIGLAAINRCNQDTVFQTFLFNFTIEPAPPEFFLYPNPANSLITFSTPRAFSYYQLFDASGKLVGQQRFSPLRQQQLSTSSYPNGLYWLRIGGTDWQLVKKLQIIR